MHNKQFGVGNGKVSGVFCKDYGEVVFCSALCSISNMGYGSARGDPSSLTAHCQIKDGKASQAAYCITWVWTQVAS